MWLEDYATFASTCLTSNFVARCTKQVFYIFQLLMMSFTLNLIMYYIINIPIYLFMRQKFFAQSEVCKYNMTFRIQKNIFQFNVSVNNSQLQIEEFKKT